MVIPIYICFIAYNPISNSILNQRLHALVQFFHLDTPEFQLHYLLNERGGLIFIEQRQSPCSVPLAWQEEKRLTVSAYLPFGVPQQMDAETMCSGRYLPDMVDRLTSTPSQIRHLSPPQVWADCNIESQTLTVFNDYRGFGKLYEYVSPFGIVWTNKMAAAPILAATHARIDEIAWAGFAANGLFYGGSTGFANMTYVAPGTWVQVDLRSGLTERRRFSTDTGGVAVEPLLSVAAEECGDAFMGWWRDFGYLSSGRKELSLSGGRDSRVVAAYALASGTNVSINTYSPPSLDADLAERLMSLVKHNTSFTRNDRRKNIEYAYKRKASFFEHAVEILRANNPDICVSSFLDCSSPSGVFQPHISLSVCGAQGEIAHPCYYQMAMVEAERLWERDITKAQSPSATHFATVCDWLSTKAWGITKAVRTMATERLVQPLLAKAATANIDGFYLLDFMYLDIYLNRHWAGSVGAYDAKTPLAVYPYVRYGFSQPLLSKLNSSFVREVISLAMPQWRDVPFFHEFPIEQQHDFHIVHPTWWEMGRGEELMDIYTTYPDLWEWFDKDTVIEAAHRWQHNESDDLAPRDTAFRTRCHRCAQRQVWVLAFLQELDEINKTICILQK